MSSLRKTLVGAAMAAALVGGTVATPAVAGNSDSNHKYGKDSYSNRHHDRDDCEYSKKYDVWYDTDHGVKDWKHHGKHGKHVWKCDDDGRWDRHDDDKDNGYKHDRHRGDDHRGDRWDRHDEDKDNGYKHDRHRGDDHRGDRWDRHDDNDKDNDKDKDKDKGDHRKDGNHRNHHKVNHDKR